MKLLELTAVRRAYGSSNMAHPSALIRILGVVLAHSRFMTQKAVRSCRGKEFPAQTADIVIDCEKCRAVRRKGASRASSVALGVGVKGTRRESVWGNGGIAPPILNWVWVVRVVRLTHWLLYQR